MKIFVSIFVICAALAPLACGEAGSTASEDEAAVALIAAADPPFAAISGGDGERPKIEPPDLPPPKKLLTRDLEPGSGPVARRGDLVKVHYVGFEYATGDEKYPGSWPPYPPGTFRLAGSNGEPFERGIEGMRVGGLREVIIPPSRFDGPDATDYVVSLVGIESKSETEVEK
jgi:peptidylprolyl isomerase